MSNATKSTYELTIQALDKFTAPFKKMASSMNVASKSANKLDSAVDKVDFSRMNVASAAGNLRNMTSQYAAFGKAVAAVATVATGGLGTLAGATSRVASETKKLSMMAGTSTQNWQQYAHAAEMAGVEQEEVASVMKDLASFANLAALGEKAEVEKFGFLGIDFKNAKGEILSTDTLLLSLADRMKELIDSGQGQMASGWLDEVFGDSGTYLLPLLEKGSVGILELRKQAEDLGLVFSDAQNKSAKDFSASFKGLAATFKGIGFSIGFELFPPFKQFMDTVKEWIFVRKDAISAEFSNWIKSINMDKVVSGTKSFLSAVGQIPTFLDKTYSVFSKFSDMVGGTENALIAVGLVISGPLIASIGALGMAIAANPIGLFATAIAAAAIAIYKNWDGIVEWFSGIDDKLSKMFVGWNLSDAGRKLISTFGEGIASYWQEFMGWFKEKFSGFTNMLSKAKNLFSFGDKEESTASSAQASNKPSPRTYLDFDSMGEDTSDEEPPAKSGTFGAPLNISPAGAMATTKTESVERQEVIIKVQAQAGAVADVQGTPSKGVSLQTGAQGMAY